MKFNINKLTTNTQTQVIFDKMLTLNKVEFESANQLKIGLGEQTLNGKMVQKLATTLANTANQFNLKALFLPVLISEIEVDDFVYIVTQAIANNDYQVQKIEIEAPEENALQSVTFERGAQSSIDKALAVVNGTALARTLGDMPSNICTPTYLAQTAQALAKEFRLDCVVLEESDMSAFGMGSLLSVSKGSIEPPKLISLSYQANGNAKPIVLVGKGVTFDSGGISLKPGTGMDEMKYDMCGAASVLGAMRAVAEMKLQVNLTIVVPAVENMPAHNASKPGDVVKSMSGQTIEILNTDAEGRLILCDALTYAQKFDPAVVIDVATLTGAVIMALGKHHSGVMANDQSLADDLIAAGESAMDTAWQLPLDDEYDELLKSNFADMANIGGREAGSVTAACFLSRFTKDYRWAHLDIAGTAWVSGAKKGATGRPVALLTQFVLDYVWQAGVKK
ncbi:leucyl aminopeptidase [bacterium endosymbiont of Bathymodiolus sp. 5 South]|jgi:leucyl aminopeptidase|uniref:leucyl aminopeptidase n=1 Tax=bacterium endosymbiont of Bathymodiolus sp. 5 South TaxID=1181670 RepID=UPI0010B1789E|nr:leucyl aminopeptidase [bacterium endosymbiont of Bathymodiolus sp. 5 South]CAC9651532.1 Cytosol aminopeptidase PepA (EC 3.4.11.1) [uncultured Gammaproteobacteria bacterium]SHN89677.1 Cytosol aminopeptidase PepA [bacterium endosymbiont of Bathymodiolus sp. 5 South]SSC08649.1 Cytosol aminopeptidase PepA [bacterium endosymbiont of Bathymodiolus sp. 5 South]VVH59755.1 Cytosol aminopeptidase PepA (EC [uncultured Gammaproteobacteria bacterium]VVH61956.1 Cytosol aminopeptidase PepA (EC [uncultured